MTIGDDLSLDCPELRISLIRYSLRPGTMSISRNMLGHPRHMKTFLRTIRIWLSPYTSLLVLWKYKLWRGKHATVAERLVVPYLRDAKYIYVFAWVFCLLSVLWEIFWPSAFERAGAVMITAGILLEQRLLQARTAVATIRNGHISPHGSVVSADLPGMFVQEWNKVKVGKVPALFWLMGQENLIFRFERRVVWLLVTGTVIWAYGSPIIKVAQTNLCSLVPSEWQCQTWNRSVKEESCPIYVSLLRA